MFNVPFLASCTLHPRLANTFCLGCSYEAYDKLQKLQLSNSLAGVQCRVCGRRSNKTISGVEYFEYCLAAVYVLILLSFSQRTEYPPSRTTPPPIPFNSSGFARLTQVLPSSVSQKAWSSASGTLTSSSSRQFELEYVGRIVFWVCSLSTACRDSMIVNENVFLYNEESRWTCLHLSSDNDRCSARSYPVPSTVAYMAEIQLCRPNLYPP